jgi:hypothetical protein
MNELNLIADRFPASAPTDEFRSVSPSEAMR